jgi:hypothetical protein
MIAVFPFSKGGHIKHSYTEHSSIVKFVERNRHLGTLRLCARHVVAAQFRRLPVELVLAFNGDSRLDM